VRVAVEQRRVVGQVDDVDGPQRGVARDLGVVAGARPVVDARPRRADLRRRAPDRAAGGVRRRPAR
jgi:hypothetical protein